MSKFVSFSLLKKYFLNSKQWEHRNFIWLLAYLLSHTITALKFLCSHSKKIVFVECAPQHGRYCKESLFCNSSIVNTLWMKNLENQCSTLRKYSCSVQGTIFFFLISNLSRTIKQSVTYIQMFGFFHWWKCNFLIFSTTQNSLY